MEENKGQNCELRVVKEANEIIQSEGVRFKDGKLIKRVNGEEKILSNFIPIVTKRITRNEDGNTLAFAEIQIVTKDYVSKPQKINVIELERKTYLSKYFGGVCNIYPEASYKDILFVTKLLLTRAKVIPEYVELGWQLNPEGKNVYVCGNEVIGSDSDALISEELKPYSIDRTDMGEELAYKQFRKLFKVADPKITYPMVSHLFCGLLFQLFRESGNSVDFVQFASGPSGSGKTTLSFLITNIFGKSNTDMNLHSSCFSTSGDLEVFMHNMNSCVAIIDDLYPSTDATESKLLSGNVQKVVRMVGDGHGKGRLGSNLKRREKFEPRSAVMLTGEYGVIGASTLSRIYSIEMTREDVNFKRLTAIQKNEAALSTCVYYFLKWIAANYDAIVDRFSERYTRYRQFIIDGLGENQFHYRKPKMAAIYLLSIELFLDYGMSIEAISEKKKYSYLNKAFDIFIDGILSQNVDALLNDPVYMYLTTIDELISSNKVRIASIGDVVKRKDLIGYQDADTLYLLPDASYQAVFASWQARGQNFPLDARSLSKALYDKKVIVVENPSKSNSSNNLHKKKKVNDNQRPRVLYIKKAVMKEILKGDNTLIKQKGKQKKKGPKCIMKFK